MAFHPTACTTILCITISLVIQKSYFYNLTKELLNTYSDMNYMNCICRVCIMNWNIALFSIMQNIAVMYFNYQILPTSLNIYLTGIMKYLYFIFVLVYFFFRIKVLLAFWTWDQKDQDTHAPKGLFGYLFDCWLQVKVNMTTSLFIIYKKLRLHI